MRANARRAKSNKRIQSPYMSMRDISHLFGVLLLACVLAVATGGAGLIWVVRCHVCLHHHTQNVFANEDSACMCARRTKKKKKKKKKPLARHKTTLSQRAHQRMLGNA